MRRTTRYLLLTTLAACLTGQAPRAHAEAGKQTPAGTTVAHFTFDHGADGWIGFYDDPGTATPQGDEGTRCLLLKTDKPVNREYVSPMFPVASKGKYRISARVRVDTFGKGYSPLSISMLWFLKPVEKHNFGGWNVFRVMPEDTNRTFGWKRVEAVIEIPDWKWMRLPITYARVQVRNYRTVGKAYVDDIRVEVAEPGAKAVNRNSRAGIQ